MRRSRSWVEINRKIWYNTYGNKWKNDMDDNTNSNTKGNAIVNSSENKKADNRFRKKNNYSKKDKPVYSKPWIPNHPEYMKDTWLKDSQTPQKNKPETKHLFTIHLGAWAKLIRDVVATILMIKVMSSL